MRARRSSTAASSRASTRVPLGIVVNKHGDRFYDEGEDFWPKRYAIWGRLVAQQPDQIAYSIVDAKVDRPLHAVGVSADRCAARSASWRRAINVPAGTLTATIERFNGAVRPGTFDHQRAGRLPHGRAGAEQDALGAARSTRRRSGPIRCGPASRSPTSA